ncbi:MAG: hypothetical protein HQL96_13045 [Magnetococcales bacterium]|nr:hypothetical protein [Magnetococcales bacterium]
MRVLARFSGMAAICLNLFWPFPGQAKEKPQFMLSDTSVSQAPGDDRIDGSDVVRTLAGDLHHRFRHCATALTMDDLRMLIGFEKQRELLGAGDPTALAEIGGALGRKGLLVTSAFHTSPAGMSLHINVMDSTGKVLGQGTASCNGRCSRVPLSTEVVAQLPDFCRPQWFGTLTYRYTEFIDIRHHAETDDGSEDALTDHFNQMDVEVRMTPDGLEDQLKVDLDAKPYGKSKVETRRVASALCGGGDEGGEEREVQGGYRETFTMSNTMGDPMCEQDACTGTVSVATDPVKGRFAIAPRIGPIRYHVHSSWHKETTTCGKNHRENGEDRIESSWPGSSPFSLEGTFAPDQTTITGSERTRREGNDKASPTVTEFWQVNLQSKPLIETLAK